MENLLCCSKLTCCIKLSNQFWGEGSTDMMASTFLNHTSNRFTYREAEHLLLLSTRQPDTWWMIHEHDVGFVITNAWTWRRMQILRLFWTRNIIFYYYFVFSFQHKIPYILLQHLLSGAIKNSILSCRHLTRHLPRMLSRIHHSAGWRKVPWLISSWWNRRISDIFACWRTLFITVCKWTKIACSYLCMN